ncbi:hypothetical protein GCM10025778_33910 [Paeniglutamicibacter antarcticus]|uniref:ArsR family transcriptional regulator n=1 Tax=Paeniglutamicibacter antarcticus TaxID=494023 RepID=A0ABP9TT28_9MICC
MGKHLGILIDAGLARRRRNGRAIGFELVPHGLEPATKHIEALPMAPTGTVSPVIAPPEV